MTVLITLTTAGTDSGPFDLYTNFDGYVSAFATGVSKSALLAGYSSSAVLDFTTTIRVKSTGNCVNYIDIPLVSPTTTTTTTTTAPPEAGITLSVSNDSAAQACAFYGDPGNEVYYYLDDPIWYISTGLYQDINETLFAPGGFWYCDGQYARLWGGTEFIGSAVTCPTIE
jgi:hypothetical protein